MITAREVRQRITKVVQQFPHIAESSDALALITELQIEVMQIAMDSMQAAHDTIKGNEQ